MSRRPVPSQLDQVLPRFSVQKPGSYHLSGRIRIAPFGKGVLRILVESGYTDLAVATNSHTMNATEEVRPCPICGRQMRLARITPRLGGLPELQTLECRPCKFVVTAEQDQNRMQS